MVMPDFSNVPLPVYADLPTVTREDWGALPPKETEEDETFKIPAEHLVLDHTNTEPCLKKEDCIKVVQELQKRDMEQGLTDIRHSYIIGGDGNIYEGRHWNKRPPLNPRCPHVFDKCFDIVLIGSYEENPIPYEMSTPTYDLIRILVRKLDLHTDFFFERLAKFKRQEVKRNFSYPEEE